MPNVNNLPLKPGFIFVPDFDGIIKLPIPFKAIRQTESGFFCKLNSEAACGWEAISFQEYQDA
jgi:hypothetical protein